MVPRIIAEYGKPMKVIATGGLAPLFDDVTDVIEAVEPDLTLLGLVEINRRNRC
jgi:type III pantothenate kinase